MAAKSEAIQKWLVAKKRVILLYEDYIHLLPLQQIWDNPVTEKPALEPCFVAAFHGIELCFLLLAEFISDDRKYVFRRPRIEMVATDIQKQCLLLTEVVDGELEEDEADVNRASLTQHFPFEACPPTTSQASHSASLQRLIDAITTSRGAMTVAERNSLIKVVLNITNTFDSSFSRWTVGLGIEHQLNELRVAAGLQEEARFRARARNLDYSQLVHPEVVEATLSGEVYEHEEDFFFRTVHLGSECWAFIVHNRIAIAQQAAEQGQWNIASARIIQAARMLHYLGDHILMLTSMNLRDYLRLKVEIQGTSGEGSKAVKAFRSTLESLFQPLTDALTYHDAVSDPGDVLDSAFSAPISPRLSPRVSTDMALKPPSQSQPSSDTQGRSKSQRLLISELQKQAGSKQSLGQQIPDAEANGDQHADSDMFQSGNQYRAGAEQPSGDHLPKAEANGNQHALTSSHHSEAAPSDSVPQGSAEQHTQHQSTAEADGNQHALTSSHHTAATPVETAQQAAAEQSLAAAPAQQSSDVEAQRVKSQQSAAAEAREAKLESLLEVYEEPDFHAGLYNYAKALEDVEAGLLAGFFYKHYCLASNVIGSESKGTGYMRSTNKAIAALKATFQTPVYPLLDQVRSALGAKIDKELAHLKGRIMDNIEAKREHSESQH